MTEQVPGQLKVLVFFAGNNTGGPGKGLLQLIENMPADAATFTVCNFRHPQQETFEFLEEARSRNVDIRLITQRWALDPGMISQALAIARGDRYDVVQSHGYKTHILAHVVSRRLGIPWIALSHGWTRENVKIRIYNAIERHYLRYADTAIGVSPRLFEEARKLRGGRPSRMILNAIADKALPADSIGRELREALGVSDDTCLIGVFGRLSPEKGQDLFIRAMSRLAATPKIAALLLGDGGQRQRLEQQARESGLADRVRFLGYQEGIERYFSAIDLCVLPSRNEGLPNVVLEAQHAGVPVVAFDVGGVGETIEDGRTGWLVRAGDVDALAERIQQVAADPDTAKFMAREARNSLFPKFSIARRCDSFLAEYRGVQTSAAVRSDAA